MLDDLLFLGSEDFSEVFVELGLVLLEFCGQGALVLDASHTSGGSVRRNYVLRRLLLNNP